MLARPAAEDDSEGRSDQYARVIIDLQRTTGGGQGALVARRLLSLTSLPVQLARADVGEFAVSTKHIPARLSSGFWTSLTVGCSPLLREVVGFIFN
jgi:hypothetical protein